MARTPFGWFKNDENVEWYQLQSKAERICTGDGNAIICRRRRVVDGMYSIYDESGEEKTTVGAHVLPDDTLGHRWAPCALRVVVSATFGL